MRASLAGFLRASGVDVVEVTSDGMNRELRNTHDERPFDAVIAGVEGKGIDAVKELRREQPGMPVVCVTREATGHSDVLDSICVKRIEREAVLEALVSAGIFTVKEVRAS
jgi:DNA-binding response OmpR family regulator